MALVIPVPAPASGDFGGCHALILEPWMGNRRLLRQTLMELGCSSVSDTSKPSEAWKTIYQGGINVLFLDWSGDTDAVGFLHELRHPDNPERFVPVVVMTAYCGAEDVTQMRDVGATEFVLRPFSQEVVASRLRSIVKAPRLFIQGGDFFGPDRRRRRVDWRTSERRNHENWNSADRRQHAAAWSGQERRQGRSGFEPLERRAAQRV